MSRVNLQLIDPSGSFEYEGVTLRGTEVRDFPNTNEVVKRAIHGRIVRVVRDEEQLPLTAPAPAAEAPATAPEEVVPAAGARPVARPATRSRASPTAE